MDKITWKYVKPVNNRMITDFLCKHNVHLSNKMVQCMMENNGGRPSVYLFNTDKGKGYVFQSLFSYNPNDKCTIYDVYPSLFENTPLFPIALESAGNIVCYNQESKCYVLWNHENNECETIIVD